MIIKKLDLLNTLIEEMSDIIYENNINDYREKLFKKICDVMNDWFYDNCDIKGMYLNGYIPAGTPIPSILNNTIFNFKLNMKLDGLVLKSAVDNYINWVDPTIVIPQKPLDTPILPLSIDRNKQFYGAFKNMWMLNNYTKSEKIIAPILDATCTTSFSFASNTINFSGFPNWNNGDQYEAFEFVINTILDGLTFPEVGATLVGTCTDGSFGQILLSDVPTFI